MAQKSARGLRMLTQTAHGRDAAQLTVAAREVPRLSPGTALLRNLYLSADHDQVTPASRLSPAGIVSPGPVIGQVLVSRTSALPPNALVVHDLGWATHTVVAPGEPSVRRVPWDPDVPSYAYLGLLGLPGLTGWAGISEVAYLRPGETVLITPAASVTGKAAAVTARSMQAGQVIGVHTEPGPPASNVRNLYDDLVAYRDLASARSFPRERTAHAHAGAVFLGPQGLAAVLGCMRDGGRVAWGIPGVPSPRQNGDPSLGLAAVRDRSIALTGYQGRRYRHLAERAEKFLSHAISDGTVAERDPVDVPFDELPAFVESLAASGTEPQVARIGTEITTSDDR